MESMQRAIPLFSLLVLVGLVVLAAGYRYDQYVVERQFVVQGAVPCDPTTTQCFVADCNPAEDSECDDTAYAKAELPAMAAPDCLLENSCESFSCNGKEACTVTYCSADILEDGEKCSDAPSPSGASDATAGTTSEPL